MMHGTTDQRLFEIKRRQAGLVAEAASDRLLAPRPVPGESDGGIAGFSGLRIRLGSLLIVIGRTLCDEDAFEAGLVRR